MTGFLWAALGVIGTLAMTALGDMVSEEVRDRLDHLPHAILRLAALRVNPSLRAGLYEDEWMPELTYILKGDEARPVTRLYHGTRFALGIFATSRESASHLRVVPVPSAPELLVLEQDVDIAEGHYQTAVGKWEEAMGYLAATNEQLAIAELALSERRRRGEGDPACAALQLAVMRRSLDALRAAAVNLF